MRGLVAAIGMALMTSNCVGHAGIEGAPCPCPEEYSCCLSLNRVCVSSLDQCPDNYPPSSGHSCSADSLCAKTEACHVWTVNEDIAGPARCRRRCPDDIPCAEGEICTLALHGGFPIEEMNAARLCLPEVGVEGCEYNDCKDCLSDQLGNTFCDLDDNVSRCLATPSPSCGLACQLVEIEDCDMSPCSEEGGAHCL
jgi:hypothetical protein